MSEPFFSDLNSQLDVLADLPPGEVKAFLCDRVTDTFSQLELIATASSRDYRIVVHAWDTLSDQAGIIEDMLQVLAQVAYRLWPSWYRQDELFFAADTLLSENAILNQFKCLELQATTQALCLPWLKAAVKACQHHKAPVLPDFSRALQLSQLALVIDPGSLVLAIALEDEHPADHQLLGLAKAASWLASQTQARVALFVPKALAQASELDSVLYGAIALSQVCQSPESSEPAEESKHVVFPIYGRPHPFSPGEQKLAEWLAEDTELASLFYFNQTVLTVRHSQYLVDLLWAEGRVIVEIDGYRHHGNQFGFNRDRIETMNF
ncbi:MAG: hypothetical protein HC886_02455 [Leptolyngbyaceae cyanobacterium SM1_1_3]|nr:hypothetical protein [Leptolyngbyaceae cyanobacterium SM1_1_3]